jgi:hypothetical protein
MKTFTEFINEGKTLGKPLELEDLKIGYPITVEKHGGMYVQAFIKDIKNDKIYYEGDSVSGNMKYNDERISLPTYGTTFTDEKGRKIKI